MRKRLTLLWLGIAAAGSLLAAVVLVGRIESTFQPASQPLHAPDRRDFELTDANGRRVSLATFKGKWVLLYFGYTYCPDVCPTSLLSVTNALKAMGERARNIQPIFVTVDPERDTAEVLQNYLANFGGNIIGLTGTSSQIADMTRRYGVFFQKQTTPDGSYLMNHSSGFELLSPTGDYVRVLRSDVAGDELAADLTAAIAAWKE